MAGDLTSRGGNMNVSTVPSYAVFFKSLFGGSFVIGRKVGVLSLKYNSASQWWSAVQRLHLANSYLWLAIHLVAKKAKQHTLGTMILEASALKPLSAVLVVGHWIAKERQVLGLAKTSFAV